MSIRENLLAMMLDGGGSPAPHSCDITLSKAARIGNSDFFVGMMCGNNPWHLDTGENFPDLSTATTGKGIWWQTVSLGIIGQIIGGKATLPLFGTRVGYSLNVGRNYNYSDGKMVLMDETTVKYGCTGFALSEYSGRKTINVGTKYRTTTWQPSGIRHGETTIDPTTVLTLYSEGIDPTSISILWINHSLSQTDWFDFKEAIGKSIQYDKVDSLTEIEVDESIYEADEIMEA